MSEIAEIIDSLENKLQKLIKKLDMMEQTSAALRQEIQKSAEVIQKQSEDIDALRKKYDSLKMVNSLLGSEETKRDTKLKINALVREIDYCIAQLAD